LSFPAKVAAVTEIEGSAVQNFEAINLGKHELAPQLKR
jgi:hypothetical protein